jgi:hypothetical protein
MMAVYWVKLRAALMVERMDLQEAVLLVALLAAELAGYLVAKSDLMWAV